ncbi:MAG: U32 family peptidase, partial [Dehalococcoidia bacterium]
AFKIEGRYKDADYVALTTHAYRSAIDAAWGVRPAAGGEAADAPAGPAADPASDPALVRDLEQVYSPPVEVSREAHEGQF